MFSHRVQVFTHQQHVSLPLLRSRLHYIVFSIVSESLNISAEFELPMAVAAHCSLKEFVQVLGDRMLQFKAKDIRFRAIEAAGGITHPLTA